VVVTVVVLVLAFVLVLADLVLDYLILVMLVVLGDPPVVLIATFVLVKDADLLLALPPPVVGYRPQWWCLWLP